MRGDLLQLRRSAEEYLVAVGRLRRHDAPVLNPAGCRHGRVVGGELRLAVGITLVRRVGVGEDLHPGSVVVDDDHLVPWSDDGDFL